jgi:hypothetical protein
MFFRGRETTLPVVEGLVEMLPVVVVVEDLQAAQNLLG